MGRRYRGRRWIGLLQREWKSIQNSFIHEQW